MPKTWTANQLVASNLRRARQDRGLTQKAAATLLEPYLGTEWSVASFSAAESTARNGARIREFSANEILAFARAFERPIAYFFTPPEEELRPVSAGGRKTIDLAGLLEAVGTIDEQRVSALIETLPPKARDKRTEAVRRATYARLGQPAVRNVTEHAANLRRLANELESFDDRVNAVLENEVDQERS